jgi:metal-dependent amidase/aminoacylase/carboxypeptidase family protein
MYACGHDGHTATLLIATKIFQDIKASLKEKIKTYLSTGRRGW